MSAIRRPAYVAVLMCALIIAAACGQKPGISARKGANAAGAVPVGSGLSVDPETGEVVNAQGEVVDELTAEELAEVTGITTEQQVAGGTTGGGTGPSTTGGGGPSTGGAAPSGGDSTGVTDEVIKIGAHAPLTGAAPLPSDSAYKGNDLYWKWLQRIEKTINGRRVEAILKNDNYNPSQAVAVCKEMVQEDKVFMLYGFAGTDQIQACARYAASVGVPYISVGVTEIGLENYPNYFAVSLTYPQQAPLLADFLTTELGAKNEKNGMLRFDTPNFQDAHDAFVSAMDERGAGLDYDREVSKQAGTAEARSVVQEMNSAGIENVYVLTSPVWFLQVLQEARAQGYAPQWTGVGITMTIDSVASVGCRNGTLNGAKFFSPFPAWAEINKYDEDFQKAVQAIYPEKDRGDDIMIITWGIAKILAELLELPGENLTRERFTYFAERARGIKTGVYPPASFSPTSHFGGTQTHVNEAQCSGYRSGDNRWHTIRSFISDF